jgi:hypothetical protein
MFSVRSVRTNNRDRVFRAWSCNASLVIFGSSGPDEEPETKPVILFVDSQEMLLPQCSVKISTPFQFPLTTTEGLEGNVISSGAKRSEHEAHSDLHETPQIHHHSIHPPDAAQAQETAPPPPRAHRIRQFFGARN